MTTPVTRLPEEEIQRLREEKARQRRFFTVSLSNIPIEGGKGYRCWDCGNRVTTVYNEPIAIVQAKVLPEDAGFQKITEHFCRNCNIAYLFI